MGSEERGEVCQQATGPKPPGQDLERGTARAGGWIIGRVTWLPELEIGSKSSHQDLSGAQSSSIPRLRDGPKRARETGTCGFCSGGGRRGRVRGLDS